MKCWHNLPPEFQFSLTIFSQKIVITELSLVNCKAIDEQTVNDIKKNREREKLKIIEAYKKKLLEVSK